MKRITKGCRNIAQFIEMVDDNYAIIQVGDSASMYAPVLASAFPYSLTGRTLNKDLLKPGCSVCIHPGSSAVVDILPPQADNDIKIMTEKPTVTYQDIGGLDVQKQELREAVQDDTNIDEELGDLLFAAVRVASTLDKDPEQALHSACEKFIKRFTAMEQSILASGRTLEELSREELLASWDAQKRNGR